MLLTKPRHLTQEQIKMRSILLYCMELATAFPFSGFQFPYLKKKTNLVYVYVCVYKGALKTLPALTSYYLPPNY